MPIEIPTSIPQQSIVNGYVQNFAGTGAVVGPGNTAAAVTPQNYLAARQMWEDVKAGRIQAPADLYNTAYFTLGQTRAPSAGQFRMATAPGTPNAPILPRSVSSTPVAGGNVVQPAPGGMVGGPATTTPTTPTAMPVRQVMGDRYFGGPANLGAYAYQTPQAPMPIAQFYESIGVTPQQIQTGMYNPTNEASLQTGQIQPFTPAGVPYSPVPTGATQFPATPEGFKLPSEIAGIGDIKMAGFLGVPDLSYNFPQEELGAYQNLKPFYDKLLSFSGGRLDLAQRILEYTYQQGVRESRQEYESGMKELGVTIPEERAQMMTAQNQRGIIESGFGQQERSRQVGRENLRAEAIQRALANRESRLTAQRGFGMEEKGRGFQEERFGLERERRQEATGMAERKFGFKQATWQSQLAKAQADEQKRINDIMMKQYQA